jgi:hypothetical protein
MFSECSLNIKKKFMANILSIHVYLYLPSSHQVSYLPTYLSTYIVATYIIYLLIMLTRVVIRECGSSRMVQKIGYQGGLLCTKHHPYIYMYVCMYVCIYANIDLLN